MFGSGFSFYIQKGLFKEYSNAEAVSTDLGSILHEFCIIIIGFHHDNFLKTLSLYEASSQRGIDSFGKTTFPVRSVHPNESLFVAQITPVIHYTLGGILVESSSHTPLIPRAD